MAFQKRHLMWPLKDSSYHESYGWLISGSFLLEVLFTFHCRCSYPSPSCRHTGLPKVPHFLFQSPLRILIAFNSPDLHSRTSSSWLDLSRVQLTNFHPCWSHLVPVPHRYWLHFCHVPVVCVLSYSCPKNIRPSLKSLLKCHFSRMHPLLTVFL